MVTKELGGFHTGCFGSFGFGAFLVVVFCPPFVGTGSALRIESFMIALSISVDGLENDEGHFANQSNHCCQ